MTYPYHATITTVLGHMRAISDGQHLIRLDWDQTMFSTADNPDYVSRETVAQLDAYLAGELKTFDLPLCAEGKSTAGRHWPDAMARIPYRTVCT